MYPCHMPFQIILEVTGVVAPLDLTLEWLQGGVYLRMVLKMRLLIRLIGASRGITLVWLLCSGLPVE